MREHSKRRIPNSNHGSLGDYLSYLFSKEKIQDLLSLRIQTPDGVREIRQRDQIASFDLLSAIIRGEKTKAEFAYSEPVVLTLDTTLRQYVFTLHPIESQLNFLSVRLVAVCTPLDFAHDYVPHSISEPQTRSQLLCYIKTELPKSESEGAESLQTPSSMAQIEQGRELVRHNCYAQAIVVLTPAHKTLQSIFFYHDEETRELYYEVCYLLGYCYTDLGQYDKASYYLVDVCNSGNYDYISEYFSCLAEARDPRIFDQINEALAAAHERFDALVKDTLDDKPSNLAEILRYVNFLKRRRGYAQINFGYLDDAEKTFQSLLSDEDSRDYAEHELKYIQQLKNQRK